MESSDFPIAGVKIAGQAMTKNLRRQHQQIPALLFLQIKPRWAALTEDLNKTVTRFSSAKRRTRVVVRSLGREESVLHSTNGQIP
ncbi:MAG: hypothetical protein IPP35_08645 [Elusimicrobia bacterium]|nr:hypothetical protein [Elusimicrobiota bacterium]